MNEEREVVEYPKEIESYILEKWLGDRLDETGVWNKKKLEEEGCEIEEIWKLIDQVLERIVELKGMMAEPEPMDKLVANTITREVKSLTGVLMQLSIIQYFLRCE